MALSFTVAPAASADLASGCRVLASAWPLAERDDRALGFQTLLESGEADPAGLFLGKDGTGVVRGAVLGQVLPGAAGLVWPPAMEDGGPFREASPRQAVEDALTAAVVGWLCAAGVKVAQVFPRAGDRAGVAPLLRHGFQLVTQLSLWRRSVAGSRSSVLPASRLDFAPAEPGSFTDALLATYEGSLDCPESAGPRTPVEMAAGYGPIPAEPFWYLARVGADAVGVVMLGRGDEPAVADVAYLGLLPAVRGRGLGKELVRFALARAAALGFRTLTLSVDVRNEPAVRLYRGHGFRAYDWRDVYLAVL